MVDHQNAGTSESLTPSSAVSLFENFVTDDESDTGEDLDSNDADGEGTEHEADGEESEVEVDPENAQLEGEDADENEEQEEAEVPEPRTLRVKLPDGEQELPEDEVVKGYLRTADYTRKNMALADERRAFVAEQEGVRGERQQYADRLTQLDEALKLQTPAEPDWDTLREENPTEFAATWADWQRHQGRLAKVAQARKEAIDVVTKDQIAHLKQHLDSENTKLQDAIPAWKDAAVAKKERKELFDYAIGQGYTEQELDSVNDHRVMLMLRKAALYDKGQAKKPLVRAVIDKVRVATPGPANAASRQPVAERTKAKQRLAKTGRVRDAAALMEDFV